MGKIKSKSVLSPAEYWEKEIYPKLCKAIDKMTKKQKRKLFDEVYKPCKRADLPPGA